jgi:hypothetical protein
MRTGSAKNGTLAMALAATLCIMRIAQCSAASVTASQPAATLNRQDDNKHTLNSASHSTAQHHGDFVPAGNDRNNTNITQATPADH